MHKAVIYEFLAPKHLIIITITKGVIKPMPYITAAAVGTKVWKNLETFEPWKILDKLPQAEIIKIKQV